MFPYIISVCVHLWPMAVSDRCFMYSLAANDVTSSILLKYSRNYIIYPNPCVLNGQPWPGGLPSTSQPCNPSPIPPEHESRHEATKDKQKKGPRWLDREQGYCFCKPFPPVIENVPSQFHSRRVGDPAAVCLAREEEEVSLA